VGYLDAAYIAKFYVDEVDSAAVRRLAESLGDVHCAALGRAEVSTALHRKLREGVFGDAAFREILAATVATVRAVPKSVFLRAADAIHLACARESGFMEVYTEDRHMTVAAEHFGVRAVVIQP